MKQRGFTLIEMALVLALAGLLGTLSFNAFKSWQARQFREAGHVHAQRAREAAEALIASHFDILTNQTSISDVCIRSVRENAPYLRKIPRVNSTTKDPGTAVATETDCKALVATANDTTMNIACAGGTCGTVPDTLQWLVDVGRLEPGYASDNPMSHSPYDLVIRVSGSAPAYNLDAVITTRAPVEPQDEISVWQVAQRMLAQTTHADMGIVRPSGTAQDGSTFTGEPYPTGDLAIWGYSLPGDKGWSLPASKFSNITATGQIGGRITFNSTSWSAYLNRSGIFPMTGDLDLGGNRIKNLKKVELDAPCDGTDVKSAASKAMDGMIGRYATRADDPNSTSVPKDQLGSSYILICGYDAYNGGYVWKKATAGVASVEDAKAGMFEGWETTAEFMCFRLVGDVVAGGTVPASAVINNGINRIKFVIKNGQAYVYIARDLNSTAAGWMQAGGPYELNGQAYDWVNTGAFPVLDYDLSTLPAGGGGEFDGYRCRWGYGWYYTSNGALAPPYAAGATVRNNPFDQYFAVLAMWKFSPGGVEFIVNGAVSRLNKVPNMPNSVYNYGGVLKDTANHTQDDLSRIPVTATGTTTTAAVVGCAPAKVRVFDTAGNPVDVAAADPNCTTAQLAVSTTGQTTARPADPNQAYDPTTNAAPVRSLTPITAQNNRTFKFQQQSNCARFGGQASQPPLAWGVAPATWCDW